MKTIKLYDRELSFIKKHKKVVIRRPEWNLKRNLYGIVGDLIKITDMRSTITCEAKISDRKHSKYKACWIILIEACI